MYVFILLIRNLKVELLGFKVNLSLIINELDKLFSKVAIWFCIPTNNAYLFQFLHILGSIWFVSFLNMVIVVDIKWHPLVVLICISLMTNFLAHFHVI